MAWPKGKPRPAGAGRSKGTPNKSTEEARALLKKLGFNPIRRAVTLANTTTDESIQAQMIKELMKYYAPQLKAVEVSAVVQHWTPELIASLSDSQLQMFMDTFDKQHEAPGIELLASPDENGVWKPQTE